MIYKISSPAKLNLHLEVGHKRDDGFHPISSIFQLIDIFDEITLEIIEGGDIVDVCMEGVDSSSNIVTKACLLYKNKFNLKFGVKIKIEKNIPMGAGLGGGSGNAAYVLLCLDKHFKCCSSVYELANIGSEIGSDIPFFILADTAIVEGRGEVVTPINTKNNISAVVIVPNINVSTSLAYNLIDKNCVSKDIFRDDLLDIYNGDVDGWNFENSFKDVVSQEYKAVKDALKLFEDSDAIYYNLSGSGAAVFGIFNSNYENIAFIKKNSAKNFNFFNVSFLSNFIRKSIIAV